MIHDRPRARLGELVRLRFPIEGGTETAWAEVRGPGLFEVANIPFYIYGVSCGDLAVARGAADDSAYDFLNVHERSGHSTYRILLRPEASPDQSRFRWQRLEALGCRHESTGRLYAVDVPADTDIHAVYEELQAGERDGLWDFEEGDCGHAVRK